MWEFRKHIHKINNIFEDDTIPCDGAFNASGNAGVYLVNINAGTDTGIFTLNYNAFGVPDRFQLLYDGNVVADSFYVGNAISGNPPNYNNMVGNTYNNIPRLIWNGSQFVADGTTQNIFINQADVAPVGQTAGAGTLIFNKINPSPTTITLRVFAPLGGTAWNISTICPQ